MAKQSENDAAGALERSSPGRSWPQETVYPGCAAALEATLRQDPVATEVGAPIVVEAGGEPEITEVGRKPESTPLLGAALPLELLK